MRCKYNKNFQNGGRTKSWSLSECSKYFLFATDSIWYAFIHIYMINLFNSSLIMWSDNFETFACRNNLQIQSKIAYQAPIFSPKVGSAYLVLDIFGKHGSWTAQNFEIEILNLIFFGWSTRVNTPLSHQFIIQKINVEFGIFGWWILIWDVSSTQTRGKIL